MAVGQPAKKGNRIAVEVKDNGGNKIQLFNVKENCVGLAMKAQYLTKSGKTIPGCWVPTGDGRIQIVFMDGGVAVVPIAAFEEPEPV